MENTFINIVDFISLIFLILGVLSTFSLGFAIDRIEKKMKKRGYPFKKELYVDDTGVDNILHPGLIKKTSNDNDVEFYRILYNRSVILFFISGIILILLRGLVELIEYISR